MKNKNLIGLSLFGALILSGCSSKQVKVKSQEIVSVTNQNRSISQRMESISIPKVSKLDTHFGKASWYGDKFQGKKTASGEPFDMYAQTAAHRTLPFNTMVKVTDMVTNKSTVVRINDRGPFAKDRILDLSRGAAKRLGLIHRGTTDVRLDIVKNSKGYEGKSSLLSKGSGCSGGKCVATKIAKNNNLSTFKSFKGQEIESVQRPSKGGSKDRYASVTQSHMAHDYDAYSNLDLLQDNNLLAISSKISVQVGAFRKHAGAKVYAKRYSLLTDQYSVKIKKEFKDAQSIYRVQVQGFSTEHEAKRFIRKYGIDGAFLVRK